MSLKTGLVTSMLISKVWVSALSPAPASSLPLVSDAAAGAPPVPASPSSMLLEHGRDDQRHGQRRRQVQSKGAEPHHRPTSSLRGPRIGPPNSVRAADTRLSTDLRARDQCSSFFVLAANWPVISPPPITWPSIACSSVSLVASGPRSSFGVQRVDVETRR